MGRLKTSPFLVGCRYIVREANVYTSAIYEIEVKEHSPSLEYVKFEYPGGNFMWHRVAEYQIVEQLKNRRAKPKKRRK